MIENAKVKIKEEMDKSTNPYIKAIGGYLLTNIEINKESAKKINTGELTLQKCLKKTEEIARGRAVNGCAVMSDEEVYKIVREYFEMVAVQDKILQVEVEEIKEVHGITDKEEDISFDVNLEDFFD